MKIGDTVSHYRIVELLGAGGMGVVYKAEDTRLKRPVALKFLPSSLLQDPQAKERLVQEAQAASALDHANICTIHEIEETSDGELFLAMAYYDGETLKERSARGPLPIDDALDLMTQITRAVAAAHDAGIIHRDIKPANILVTPRGEVKLLDFGIAKLQGQTALTRTGTTVGTVAYMSPEQIAGQGVDARSDVWSLGVVLYQLLTGAPPFLGGSDAAIVHAIATASPPSLRTLRSDAPPEIERIVMRALEKDAGRRYPSARELLGAIESVRAAHDTTGRTPAAEAGRRQHGVRTRLLAVAAVVAALAVAGAGGWLAYRSSRVRWARTQALPQISTLIHQEQPAAAFRLLREIEPYVGDDPTFVALRNGFLINTTIRTTPPGADVYLKGYNEVDRDWEYIGRSPIAMRAPIGYFRWRVTKPGFTPFEGASGATLGDVEFNLAAAGSLPDGMVRVAGTTVRAGSGAALRDFFLDKFEVTNGAFKTFVDAGGYRSREFWREPFVRDGRTLSWEAASAEFRDATGRPGPSTWELGSYPEGQADFPVRGISWYEAAAYARFAGKQLPTVYHWRRAAGFGIYSDILEFSNFAGKGPARVGAFQGLGPYGTYDMAGNVKEWTWNAADDRRRYILGGAWNEPNYQYQSADARPPFDRSANNGVRLMRSIDAAPPAPALLEPVVRVNRDYARESPVSDDVYRAYTGLYSYDRTELKPSIDATDDSSSAWRMERITYNAAYGNERVIAYLFLPKNVAPPYQTVVYVPHSGGFALRSFEQAEMSYLGFVVKAGRALLFPMYKGMYERRAAVRAAGPNAQRDETIQQVKDLRRSIDYLETRPDIDRSRLGYFGVSYGAGIAPIALAVEPRFKAAVLWSGGLSANPNAPPPEIDAINYAGHVRTPLLMLNGRDDFTFPIDTSQLPLFRALRTPDADKRHVIYDGGHVFPFARIEKDTLDWLDTYLGVPK